MISVKPVTPAVTKTIESSTRFVAPGTVFASRYEILDSIGAGGMGEVYRALDRNLGRQVAIKILPAAFAEDKERMARFDREAKLLAILNHPNIAAIHGLEESEGRRFLVLELAEGETLQARLNQGVLSVEESLDVCRQLAEGLEAAHEKGIVHRDLKPGNIMITPEGRVKILDFGLAKAYGGETTGIEIEKSPTITAQMTEPGIILGTAAYMSPEQARSRPVDKRTDIWSFGCVLYECLTGHRAFYGETVSDTLAHILKGEPDWSKLAPDTPIHIRTLLRHCLEKSPKERLHDIADARLEIESPSKYAPESAIFPWKRATIWLAAGGAAVLFAGVFIGRLFFRHPQTTIVAPEVTSTVKIEPGHWLDGMRRAQEREWPSRKAVAISSDGRFLVYCAIEENPGPGVRPQLYLRRMDQAEAKPITGTEGGISPFLSPDNRWVGFLADGKLRKVPVDGGVPTTLCNVVALFGASWGPSDQVVFGDGETTDLYTVSADGGTAEKLTLRNTKHEAECYRLPSWLPNGKAILFTVLKNPWDSQPGLALLESDTRQWRPLLQDAADAKYLATGHILFLRQGVLTAVRFDEVKLEVIGQPSALLSNVMHVFAPWGISNTGQGQFDVSGSGSLVFATGGVLPDIQNSLVWVDQNGSEQTVSPLRMPFQAPRLSPDGRRIVYVTAGREWSVYVYDLETGINSRLTHEGMCARAIWTPDGKRITFTLEESSAADVFSQVFDGSSPMQRLTTGNYAGSWSPDGLTLALVKQSPDTGYDIVMWDARSGQLTPFLNSRFNETYPEFSPDGKWIAYGSNESGREEVYVRAFPGPGMKHQISSEGGIQPLWSRDRKQLFYRSGDQVWVVDVRADGDFSTGKPRLLFERPGYTPGGPIRSYDISLDGKRFLMVKLEQRKPLPVTELTLIQNWFEELKRLVPIGKK